MKIERFSTKLFSGRSVEDEPLFEELSLIHELDERLRKKIPGYVAMVVVGSILKGYAE